MKNNGRSQKITVEEKKRWGKKWEQNTKQIADKVQDKYYNKSPSELSESSKTKTSNDNDIT